MALADDPSVRPSAIQKSIVDEITIRIRREILTGRIRPGERIRLRTLEELLGVSHIPIREALRRLEGEGLVQNVPQRGALATSVSAVEVAEVYDLRRIIESTVAERAIPKITSERLGLIGQAFERLNAVPGGWGSSEFPEAHRRFHWLMLEPGGTPLIERQLTQLWQMSERYVRLAVVVGKGGPVAESQHFRLFAACRARDVDRFRRELRAHLTNTETRVLKALREQTPVGKP